MADAEKDLTNSKKETFTGLARKLSRLPNEKKIVALEMSASLAGVSLSASREFVEAVPKAAKILSADDLRHWAEMGRRLAMANADLGAEFFHRRQNQKISKSSEKSASARFSNLLAPIDSFKFDRTRNF